MLVDGSTLLNDDTNPHLAWKICTATSDGEIPSLGYVEHMSSGAQGWADDSSQLTRVLHCRFDELYLFLQDLLGQSLLMSNNKISRRIPDQHPVYGDFFAAEAQVKPIRLTGNDGSPTYRIQFKRAEVTVVYRQFNYWLKTDKAIGAPGTQLEYNRFCSFEENYDSAFVVDNCGQQATQEGGSKVNLRRPSPRTIPATELVITWHKVPTKDSDPLRCPTADTINALQGSVNDRVFFGYPAETVLFLGAVPKQSNINVDNNPDYEVPSIVWNIAYKFKVRNVEIAGGSERAGWNHTLVCGNWLQAAFVNGKELCPTANLYDLWTITS